MQDIDPISAMIKGLQSEVFPLVILQRIEFCYHISFNQYSTISLINQA